VRAFLFYVDLVDGKRELGLGRVLGVVKRRIEGLVEIGHLVREGLIITLIQKALIIG
jgi:hypothetical protein